MDRSRLRDAARSVRVRIVLSILLVAALGMATAAIVTIFVQRERVLAQVDDRLEHIAGDVSAAAGGGDAQGRLPGTVRDLLIAAMARVVPDHNESTIAFIDGRAALVPQPTCRSGSRTTVSSSIASCARPTSTRW